MTMVLQDILTPRESPERKGIERAALQNVFSPRLLICQVTVKFDLSTSLGGQNKFEVSTERFQFCFETQI